MSNDYGLDMLRKRMDPICAALAKEPPVAPAPVLTAAQRLGISDDMPAIEERHQLWWQVHKFVRAAGQVRTVLIFESLAEDRAMAVCDAQRYRCRVSKDAKRVRPYFNSKEPKDVAVCQGCEQAPVTTTWDGVEVCSSCRLTRKLAARQKAREADAHNDEDRSLAGYSDEERARI